MSNNTVESSLLYLIFLNVLGKQMLNRCVDVPVYKHLYIWRIFNSHNNTSSTVSAQSHAHIQHTLSSKLAYQYLASS